MYIFNSKKGIFIISGNDSQANMEFVIDNLSKLIIVGNTGLSESAIEFGQYLNMQFVGSKFSQPHSLWLLPNHSNQVGIFTVGPGRQSMDYSLLQKDVQAVALQVREHLKATFPEEHIPIVDKDKCAFCLTCVRICPFGAMARDNDQRVARVVESVCKACGICITECPASALSMRNLKDETISASIKTLSEE